MAAHQTVAQAVEHAWLELVERDAFIRMWLRASSDPPTRIDPRSFPITERGIAERLATFGDLTVVAPPSFDGVPTFIARLDCYEHLALGAGAHWDPAEALASALAEACSQVIAPLRSSVSCDADVKSPIDHGALYSRPDRRRELDWMLEGETCAFSDLTATPASLPRRALWFHFNDRSVWPVEVVRVIDPLLIPITFGYDGDLLGRTDVRQLCQEGPRDAIGPLPVHPFA